MNGTTDPIRTAHRMAYGAGLALCLGTPSLITVLLLSGVVPAGIQSPEGIYLDVGFLFTGLVFLSAAWVWWRSVHTLRTFKDLPETQRPATILRESLIYAVVFESSSLCGLVYWILVGNLGYRHVWGFILMTPLLFLVLVPRYTQWVKALEL